MSWIDGNSVQMMSTIHGVKHWKENFVVKNRSRPKATASNAGTTRTPFGKQQRRCLPIPKIIDDYSRNMNGVDSFDQRRAAFDASLRCRRNWFSIYQFLLDIALSNTIVLTRMKEWVPSSTTTAHIRLGVTQQAIMEARHKMEIEKEAHDSGTSMRSTRLTTNRGPYVSRRSVELPASRFQQGIHLPIYESLRRKCYLCRFLNQERSAAERNRKTATRCSKCNVYLCFGRERNCFNAYHTRISELRMNHRVAW